MDVRTQTATGHGYTDVEGLNIENSHNRLVTQLCVATAHPISYL